MTCQTVICPYSSDSCDVYVELSTKHAIHREQFGQKLKDFGMIQVRYLTIIELVYMWGGLGERYLPLSKGFYWSYDLYHNVKLIVHNVFYDLYPNKENMNIPGCYLCIWRHLQEGYVLILTTFYMLF